MELRQFLRVIFHHRYMIILMCLSAIITAIFLTYVLSEKYKSSTIVLIRPQKSIDLVPKREEILNFPVSYYSPVETASKTYTEIIKSRVIAERVINLLGLDAMKEDEGTGWGYYWKKTKTGIKNFLKKSWAVLKYGRIEEDDSFNRAVSEIQGGLSVKPTKETYLFEIEAEARSPQLASAIANASAKVFVSYLKEQSLRELENARQLSEEKLEQSNQKVEKAREALAKFKEREGVVSLKNETALQLELLGELDSSLKTINTDIRGAIAQKKEIARQLIEIDNFIKSAETVIDNPILRDLKLGLAQKEIALEGLRVKFAPEHREIRMLLAEINEIKKKIKQHDPTLNSEVTSTVNPTYQNLLNEQANLENELELLKAKKDELSLAIENKKKILEELPFKEARLATLELTISLQEQTHELLTKESEELKMAAIRRVPDIQMIHPAVTPLYPSKPIKIYHAGLAAFLSFLIGIAIALLKEHMNESLRSTQEAEKALALPVLMTVPELVLSSNGSWPLIIEENNKIPEVIRKHMRIPVQIPILVHSHKSNLPMKGSLLNISRGGACFNMEIKEGIGPHDIITMEIIDSGVPAKKVIAEGVIARSEKVPEKQNMLKVAVEFTNFNGAMSRELKRLYQWGNNEGSSLMPSDFEEPIRGLRTDAQFFRKEAVSSFLITSSLPHEGKSTITANLGLSLVAIKRSVVLVDANLRDPSLHRLFGLPIKPGLMNILMGNMSLTMKRLPSGLYVIPSGSAIKDPSALFSSKRMAYLIAYLKRRFDFVLIDTPPVLAGPDSAQLATIADGVILVVDAGRTTISESGRAKSILEKSGTKILGVVLNNYHSDFEAFYSCGANQTEI